MPTLTPPGIIIRSEKISDIEAIDTLIKNAFNNDDEAILVKKLRDKGALTFSIVALNKDTNTLAGHLAFSMVSIEGSVRTWQALGLAPLSVMPELQNKGIGSALVNFWFQEYADDFYNAVVLVGAPYFYQRFGFKNAKAHGLQWEQSGFEDAFQIKEIKEGFLSKISGTVFYDEVFSGG